MGLLRLCGVVSSGGGGGGLDVDLRFFDDGPDDDGLEEDFAPGVLLFSPA